MQVSYIYLAPNCRSTYCMSLDASKRVVQSLHSDNPSSWGSCVPCNSTDLSGVLYGYQQRSSSTMHSFLLLPVGLQFALKWFHVRLWKSRRPPSSSTFQEPTSATALPGVLPRYLDIKFRPFSLLKIRLELLTTIGLQVL